MVNKVFHFDTEEAARVNEEEISKILYRWILRHPHYECSIHKIVRNTGFEIIVNCNDITHSDSRAN